MTTYKDAIDSCMQEIARKKESVFIGYNLKFGSCCYGTMNSIPESKIYEMPVAEDLMTGIATGMALGGYFPVLIFERQDFMLIASDQIINHLSKIQELSHGEFNPKVIIRAIVGHNKPFDPGPQHLQDFTDFFTRHCSFPVISCTTPDQIKKAYKSALEENQSTMIVDYKAFY